MDKKITATVIVAAATLGTGTFEAKADTVNPNDANQASTTSVVPNSNEDTSDAVSTTQAAVSQAQQNVSTATSNVSTATQAQATAQTAVSSAAQAAADETAKLSQLSPEELYQERAAATKAVADDRVKVQTTTTDLNVAQSQASAATSNVTSATSTAAVATSDLQQAKTAAGSAQTAVSQANVAVSAAEDDVHRLQAQVDEQPKINIDVATWKSLVTEDNDIGNLPILQQGIALAKLQVKIDTFVAQTLANSSYAPSDTDGEETVASIDAVTQDQWEDLTKFALGLVNQLMEQWYGDKSHNFTSTLEDITLGKQYMNDYNLNKIDKVWEENNSLCQQFGFNSGSTVSGVSKNDVVWKNKLDAGTITIGDMKQALYQNICNWSGLIDAFSSGSIASNSYLGLIFDNDGGILEYLHTPFNIPNAANTTFITPVDYVAQLAVAKVVLATKTTDAEAATRTLDQANATVVDATDRNQQAQATLQDVQKLLAAKVADVETLTAQLAAAKTQLAKDLAWLASINQAIANLKAAIAKQTDMVTQAQAMVVSTGTALNNANATLAAAKAALQQAETQLAIAQADEAKANTQQVVTRPTQPSDKPNTSDQPTVPMQPVKESSQGTNNQPTVPTQSNDNNQATSQSQSINVRNEDKPVGITWPNIRTGMTVGKKTPLILVSAPAKRETTWHTSIRSYQTKNQGGVVGMPSVRPMRHQPEWSYTSPNKVLPQTSEKRTRNQGIVAGMLTLLTSIVLFGRRRQH